MTEPIKINLRESDRLYTWDGEYYLIRSVPGEGWIPDDTREHLVRCLLLTMKDQGIQATDFAWIWEFLRVEIPMMVRKDASDDLR